MKKTILTMVAAVSLGACGRGQPLDLAAAPLQRQNNFNKESSPYQRAPASLTDLWQEPLHAEAPLGAAVVSQPAAPDLPSRDRRFIWVHIFPVLEGKKAGSLFARKMAGPDPYEATHDLGSVKLGSDSGFKLIRLKDGTVLSSGRALSFDLNGGKIRLDALTLDYEDVFVTGSDETVTTVTWDSSKTEFKYRGGFVVTREQTPEGLATLRVVNIVGFETYVKDVVPGEMPPNYPAEALKVQAVAARTYAANKMLAARCDANVKTGQCARKQALPFDVFANTQDQLYLGIAKETERASEAVAKTTHMVATYKGTIIQAMFHANSGGRTCSYFDCYGDARVSYLQSVPEPNPDALRRIPGGEHSQVLDSAKFINALRSYGVPFSDQKIVSITPVTNASQRAHALLVRGPAGEVTVGEEILDRLRWRFQIPTAYMDESEGRGNRVTLTSYGWGHGVGISQEGARLQAEAGRGFRDIVEYYYKGVKVVDLKSL